MDNSNKVNDENSKKSPVKTWLMIVLVIVLVLIVLALSLFLWNLVGPQPMTVLTQKDFRHLR